MNQSGGGRNKDEYMNSRTLLEMKLLELVSDKVDVEDESQWPQGTCTADERIVAPTTEMQA